MFGPGNPQNAMMSQNTRGNSMSRNGLPAELQQLLAQREAKQQQERQKVIALLGLGAAVASRMGGANGANGASGANVAKGASGAESARTARGGGGGNAQQSSAQTAQAKFDPVTLATAGSSIASAAGGTTGAGLAAGGGGFLGALANPGVGALISGGSTLVDGLINGGQDDELAKKQLRQQGQQHLFDGIRQLSNQLATRNAEFRGLLASFR